MNKISQWLKLSRSMGIRYVSFRLFYEAQRKSRFLKRYFPTTPPFQTWISLADWRETAPSFFFSSRDVFKAADVPSKALIDDVEKILKGGIRFFHGEWKAIAPTDWLTNPVTGFTYDSSQHWTEIPDFDPACGDIKYVWEKSRFSFLQTILRYDAEYHTDTSHWVFWQIESWIDHNPVNQGPNYRCSQEISLRVFNWILALYFYRDSFNLKEQLFRKILFNIYWQIRHVRSNIHFSRIAVRNNHAITETLALYTCGLLFPFFKEASEWKASGKKWFEEEISYQIYGDGTYLQFSTNYHRIVVQLLTWGISLAQIHNDQFDDRVYERAYASLNFLLRCQDNSSGQLPNYGANDGSLFFNWNDSDYRDYRPALDALHYLLTNSNVYPARYNDRQWFGIGKGLSDKPVVVKDGTYSFKEGGIYIYRKDALLIFITCVRYKDRPQQADNLHLDLWYDGKNILWDAGSYRYNASPELVKYFFGTESHNTVMLDDYDQMLKAQRFVWLGWSRGVQAGWYTEGDKVQFTGTANVFTYLGDISHTRTLEISGHTIKVTDKIKGAENKAMKQIWHINPEAEDRIMLLPDHPINTKCTERYYSPTYGVIEKSLQVEFVTGNDSITTEIRLK